MKIVRIFFLLGMATASLIQEPPTVQKVSRELENLKPKQQIRYLKNYVLAQGDRPNVTLDKLRFLIQNGQKKALRKLFLDGKLGIFDNYVKKKGQEKNLKLTDLIIGLLGISYSTLRNYSVPGNVLKVEEQQDEMKRNELQRVLKTQQSEGLWKSNLQIIDDLENYYDKMERHLTSQIIALDGTSKIRAQKKISAQNLQ